MNYILEQVGRALLVHPIEPKRKNKKQTEKKRELTRDDAISLTLLTIFFFFLARVPLFGHKTVGASESIMTFSRRNSVMALGTSPFVLASMALNLWDSKMENVEVLAAGYVLTIAQALMICSGVVSYIELIIVGWALMNAIHFSDSCGTVGLTTILIVVDGANRIVTSGGISIVLSILCVYCMCYINELHIAVRLSHTKSRQDTSARLPLMYSGTTPLIVYYTVMEWIPIDLPFLLCIPCVYFLSLQWPSINNKTGFALMKEYSENDFTMKGWRSPSAMGMHMDKQVQKLAELNAYVLIGMALCSAYAGIGVSAGTVLIIVQAVRQTGLHDRLQQPIHQLLKLLRL